MGLEGLSGNGSVGPVTPEGVTRTMQWAAKHGFSLGDIHAKREPTVAGRAARAEEPESVGLVA
jgi:hypothetical protein